MTKSKKIIVGGLIAMLGIVGATTATSGVAWFTTTRTATISIDNFIATAAEGNLQIADGGVINEAQGGLTHTVDTNNNTSSISATAKLTDVSSVNGVNFFKVSTVNNVSTTRQETGITNSINNTLYNYYAWDIAVTNTSPNAKMDVYITKNGNIFTDVVTESPNINPEQWYRMCIFNGSIAANNLVFAYGQENTSDKKDKGIASTGDTTGTSDFTRAVTCTAVNADPGHAATAVQDVTDQLLIKDLLGEAQTLIFVVWCEGLLTPADGTDLEVNGEFNLVGFNHA